jgi:hypothetical protein
VTLSVGIGEAFADIVVRLCVGIGVSTCDIGAADGGNEMTGGGVGGFDGEAVETGGGVVGFGVGF